MIGQQAAPQPPDEQGGPPRRVVLVVDDQSDILVSLRDLLESSLPGVVVHTAASGGEALDIIDAEPVEVIVTDYKMPGMDGIELLQRLEEHRPGVRRVMMTAFADPELAERAEQDGRVSAFLPKPFDLDVLLGVVADLLGSVDPSDAREA